VVPTATGETTRVAFTLLCRSCMMVPFMNSMKKARAWRAFFLACGCA
jgi:hypothetical protein